MNPILGWKTILHSASNAKKLLKLLPKLSPATMETMLVLNDLGLPVAYLNQRVPMMCPAKLLFGEKKSQQLYLQTELRAALDAWDTGEIGPGQLAIICQALIAEEKANA